MTKKSNFDEILAAIPADRQLMAADILDELIFTKKLLAQLKKLIAERGVAEVYPKGRTMCLRESPAVKSYTSLLQKYSQLYRQLENLLPKSTSYNNNNPLLEFVQNQP